MGQSSTFNRGNDKISSSVSDAMQNVAKLANIGGNQKLNKMKIKFAKEFFVTEKGEIVKMAGIVAQAPAIIRALTA